MKVELLQPFNFRQPGEILDLPDNVASMVIMRKQGRTVEEVRQPKADSRKTVKAGRK